jgi:hypothetical protein
MYSDLATKLPEASIILYAYVSAATRTGKGDRGGTRRSSHRLRDRARVLGSCRGEGNADLRALIGAASEFAGPGFLLPTRNGAVFRWCLEHGLRIVQPMTLMSIGLYHEPLGAFSPSIVY